MYLLSLPLCVCNVCVCKPTELFDKLLHMEVEGVDDGSSRLVVIVIDGYGGETTSNLTLFKHIHLYLWAEVLPQEVGCGTASYTCPHHRWNRWRQSVNLVIWKWNMSYYDILLSQYVVFLLNYVPYW